MINKVFSKICGPKICEGYACQLFSVILALVFLLWTPSSLAQEPLSQESLSQEGRPKEERPKEERAHGATRTNRDQDLQVWNAGSGAWVTPESFWETWASTHGGLRWGRRADYPPYAEVSERDLMIVELPQGACLMEFWHRRWRRAQDVRRWSPAFNTYGGCPFVFD